jgi:hypothetical protein
MTRISVPTVSENLSSYDALFALWHQVSSGARLISFEFSNCTFIGQSGVAFLGGVARVLERRGVEVTFDWDTLRNVIRTNLAQSGFLSAFGESIEPWEGNSIPYREDDGTDKDSIVEYLADRWLGRDWVHMSNGLRNALAARVCAIYVNAFEHSDSRVGVFSCGQHYPG